MGGDSSNRLTLSGLGHTWVLDLDGTILKHNGHKTAEGDSFLPVAKEFLSQIPKGDLVVFITSRTDEYRSATESFLAENAVRYDAIIFNAPYGERILVNDSKPSGLPMAYCCRLKRDSFDVRFEIDPAL